MIGLTGPNASGKGEVSKLFTARQFAIHSLSDVVREAATEAGLSHTRDNLIAVGVRLRTEGGAGALARKILPRLTGRDIVDSIRNPGEVEILRTLKRFVLLGIDAPLALRFERSLNRGRIGDGSTLADFARKEARENSETEAGQQLRLTLGLADAVIQNDGPLETLAAKADAALLPFGLSLQ